MDYLVNLVASGARCGAANPPVTIFDGPAVTELDPPLKLYVGWTDPDNTTTRRSRRRQSADLKGIGSVQP